MNVIDITKLKCKSINQIIPFFSKIIYNLKVNFPNIKEEEFICKFGFEETKDGILRTSFQIIYFQSESDTNYNKHLLEKKKNSKDLENRERKELVKF